MRRKGCTETDRKAYHSAHDANEDTLRAARVAPMNPHAVLGAEKRTIVNGTHHTGSSHWAHGDRMTRTDSLEDSKLEEEIRRHVATYPAGGLRRNGFRLSPKGYNLPGRLLRVRNASATPIQIILRGRVLRGHFGPTMAEGPCPDCDRGPRSVHVQGMAWTPFAFFREGAQVTHFENMTLMTCGPLEAPGGRGLFPGFGTGPGIVHFQSMACTTFGLFEALIGRGPFSGFREGARNCAFSNYDLYYFWAI